MCPVRNADNPNWYLLRELFLLSDEAVELCPGTDRREVSRTSSRFKTEQLIFIPFRGLD
jgi:hypothetical protein